MAPRNNPDQLKEDLFNALPETGEVNYRTFHQEQTDIGKGQMLQFWTQLKRDGRINVRTEYNAETGKTETYFSRAS